MQAPPGMNVDSLPRPIAVPSIWFKTANSQVVHDALVEFSSGNPVCGGVVSLTSKHLKR
jgi:hypothetical protein